jgi:hypothetical protein
VKLWFNYILYNTEFFIIGFFNEFEFIGAAATFYLIPSGRCGKNRNFTIFLDSVADFRYHLIQLQDENLAPFWGGSGKPAPKKGSAEFLKKEGEGRRQETQIWHRR